MEHHAFVIAGLGPDLDFDVGSHTRHVQRRVIQVDLDDLAGNDDALIASRPEFDLRSIDQFPHFELSLTEQDQAVGMIRIAFENRRDFVVRVGVFLLIEEYFGPREVNAFPQIVVTDQHQFVQLGDRGAKVSRYAIDHHGPQR